MAAYNNYFPAGYQPMYNYPSQHPIQQPASNGLIWVQGEAGAKSYLVAPNTTVMLMDSESDTFYIKSSDASGMPMPLRVFNYKEKTGEQPTKDQPKIDYVTKAEFNQLKDKIHKFLTPKSEDDDE